jgi:hypothetical protein
VSEKLQDQSGAPKMAEPDRITLLRQAIAGKQQELDRLNAEKLRLEIELKLELDGIKRCEMLE